jgi:hypothetical protein
MEGLKADQFLSSKGNLRTLSICPPRSEMVGVEGII